MQGTLDLVSLEANGFDIARKVIQAQTINSLRSALATIGQQQSDANRQSPNARGLLESCPAVVQLAQSAELRQIVGAVLGSDARPVRGILFDKAVHGNWHVGWHQDLVIPVQQRVDTSGFTSWSVKQGAAHVQAPADVLSQMLTLRVHLDDCRTDNGPLQVLPGSHQLGVVPEAKVRSVVADGQTRVCLAAAGDVLVMRPLLLHASQPATNPTRRRVVHLEYAAAPLPGGLDWYCPTPSSS